MATVTREQLQKALSSLSALEGMASGYCELQDGFDTSKGIAENVRQLLAALASPPAEDELQRHDCEAWAMEGIGCAHCNPVALAIRAAQAPPASDPPGLATWQGHDDCPTCGQPAKWKPLGQYMRTVDRRATLAARQSDPPGLASLTRSLCEALWDLQSSPDCWCPPDRSCTEPHTEACAAARAVNGAAKRFHLYNELPLAAPASPQAETKGDE